MRYIILIHSLYLPGYAQLSGRITSNGLPDIILETTILQTGEKTEADFDGNFSVKTAKAIATYDVLINAGTMNFKIQNLDPNMTAVNIGDVNLPVLKNITVEQYNELTEIDKTKYIPVYH